MPLPRQLHPVLQQQAQGLAGVVQRQHPGSMLPYKPSPPPIWGHPGSLPSQFLGGPVRQMPQYQGGPVHQAPQVPGRRPMPQYEGRPIGHHGSGPFGPGGAPIPDEWNGPGRAGFTNAVDPEGDNMAHQMLRAIRLGILPEQLRARILAGQGNPAVLHRIYGNWVDNLRRQAARNGFGGRGGIRAYLDFLRAQQQEEQLAGHLRNARTAVGG